jgi:hypothetical protein
MPFIIDFKESTKLTNNQLYSLVWNRLKKFVFIEVDKEKKEINEKDIIEDANEDNKQQDRFEGQPWNQVKVR